MEGGKEGRQNKRQKTRMYKGKKEVCKEIRIDRREEGCMEGNKDVPKERRRYRRK